MIAWVFLVFASICEVVWTYFMKVSDGFSKLKPAILMVIFNILSTIFLALAVKDLPISVAYPIWTGIGAMGTVAIGILAFNESKSFKNTSF